MTPRWLLDERRSTLYLAVGVLSLAKALAIRHDRKRFRRELADAGLFIGLGFLLRRYGRIAERRRTQVHEVLPDWTDGSRLPGPLSGQADGEDDSDGWIRRTMPVGG